MKKTGEKTRIVLFGDNAYLNSPYMATPFPHVSSAIPEQKSKGSYSFNQSQIRIQVECGFGNSSSGVEHFTMPVTQNISKQRIIEMIKSLTKL